MGKNKGNKGAAKTVEKDIGKTSSTIKKEKVRKIDSKAIDDLLSDIGDIKAAKRRQEEEESKEEEEDYGPPLVPHTGKMSSDKQVTYGLIKPEGEVIISPEAPLERMQDGVAVYKAHLLRVGQGGGTELCPFDCDCCF